MLVQTRFQKFSGFEVTKGCLFIPWEVWFFFFFGYWELQISPNPDS